MTALAPAAAADNSLSQNWAGYAVHGAIFQRVSGSWHQPRPICHPGQTRYSAMWLGLGGYSLTSGAVEQIGTELDCIHGHAASSAWYELVPGPSRTLALPIGPGDLLAASVTAVNGKVTVAIDNLTRHRSFRQTLVPTLLDVSSAEWILEAPSSCVAGTTSCRTLPLADFRHATFTGVRVQRAGGMIGAIVSSAWKRTMISLGPEGTRFVTDRRGGTPVGTAKPTRLTPGGSSFTITYRQRYVPAGVLYEARMRAGPQSLVHRGRS